MATTPSLKTPFFEPEWRADPVFERAADLYNVRWKLYENESTANIDKDQSKWNMGRVGGAIIPEHVEEIVDRSRQIRLVFGPLVGWRPDPSSPFILNNGNHRIAALDKMHFTHCWIYEIFDLSVTQRDEFTRYLATLEGRGLNEADRLTHAIHVAGLPENKDPERLPEIAKKYAVSLKALQRGYDLEVYRARMDYGGDLFVAEHRRVGDDVVHMVVVAFRNHHAVLRAIIDGISKLTFASDREAVRVLIDAVNKVQPKTESNMLAEAQKQLAALADRDAVKVNKHRAGKSVKKLTPADRLMAAAGRLSHTIATHLNDASSLSVFRTPAEREDWVASASILIDDLGESVKELRSAVGLRPKR